MASCEYMQYALQQKSTSQDHTKDSTSQEKTLPLTYYPMELVQSLVSYLYTGIMEQAEGERFELFEQLLAEYGLMPHYTFTLDERSSPKPVISQERKPKGLDMIHKESETEVSQNIDPQRQERHSDGQAADFDQSTKIKREIDSEFNIEAPSRNDPVHDPVHDDDESDYKDHRDGENDLVKQNVDQTEPKCQTGGDVESQKPFPCSDCGMRWDSYTGLMNHTCEGEWGAASSQKPGEKKKVHHKKKMHPEKKLNYGMKLHPKKKGQRMKKVHSEKEMQSEKKVLLKKKGHSENKVHLCTICGKIYRHRPTLIEHIGTHTKEKTNICVLCNKSFYRKRSLKVHMRSHSTGKT